LRARSGDGRVRVQASGSAPTGDWSLATGDGSVLLEVPAGFGAELDARTGDGRVEVRDVDFERESGEHSRTSAKGRIGSGGPKVTIRSGDGERDAAAALDELLALGATSGADTACGLVAALHAWSRAPSFAEAA